MSCTSDQRSRCSLPGDGSQARGRANARETASVRLAIDATPLLDVRTGVGTFVVEVLARLAKLSEVDVVAYGLTARYLSQLRGLVPAGIGVTKYPIPQRTCLRLWRRSNHPALEWWTGRVGVVHGTNFIVPPARRAAQLMTVHDLTPIHYPELCDAFTVRYPTYIRRALSRGAHVHTVSRFVAHEVVEAFGTAPDRVHTVHNGVSLVAGGDPSRGRQLAGGRQYVLALGTVEPRKNYGLLVEAFDAIAAAQTDLALVIAGRAGWRMKAFDEALGAARHRDRIVALGWVSDEQRADLLAGATVLAYPSRYEGFGLPPLEAMSAGVPVVATAIGALPEVLGDAALLVDADRDALSDALQRVVVSDTLRGQLIARGLDRASLYSWDRCGREMADLYGRIAGE